jgi:hypothetical protein
LWQLGKVPINEINGLVTYAKAILFENDAAEIVPAFLKFTIVEVRDLESLLDLAPIDALFERHLRQRRLLTPVWLF